MGFLWTQVPRCPFLHYHCWRGLRVWEIPSYSLSRICTDLLLREHMRLELLGIGFYAPRSGTIAWSKCGTIH